MDAAASERHARAALAAKPNDPWLEVQLGYTLLRQGRYAEGFKLVTSRDRMPLFEVGEMRLPFPKWEGQDLAGKSFIVSSCEGVGDQIMFARFMHLLQERGAEIFWLCPPELARLAHECLGLRPIPMVGELELPAFDFFSSTTNLPSLFFPPLTAPPSDPYLKPPPPVRAPGLTVGVCTHGNPKHMHDAIRSLPEHLHGELLSLPGAIDLKPESTGAKDYYNTAQVIAGLDLVVTVDTAVAHLAGAMGKPVWVLLAERHTDWRWMTGRADSAWYPSARLFRQGADEDWRPVLESVREALAQRSAQESAAATR